MTATPATAGQPLSCQYVARGPGFYEGQVPPVPSTGITRPAYWWISVNGSRVANGEVGAGPLPTRAGDLVQVYLSDTSSLWVQFPRCPCGLGASARLGSVTARDA